MSKIKVGQIYINDYIKYTITNTIPNIVDGFIEKTYQAIAKDGYCFDVLYEDYIKKSKMIAEYPTWQEAVNSKEFKNVAED